MAWTPTFSKETVNDTLIAVITYTDGKRTVVDRFDIQGLIDNDYIARKSKSKIEWLTQQDLSFAALTEGVVTPKDTPVITPPPTSKDEQDRVQFFADYRKWQEVKKAIDAEILDPSLPEVAALKDKVLSEFKIEYLITP